MRSFLAALATLLVASTAAAEPPTSPEGGKLTGYGFVGTGAVLAGTGGYLFARGASRSDEPTSTKLGVALFAGGLVSAGVGVVLLLGPAEKKMQPPRPRQALLLGPAGASFVGSF
jgi:hypothetical protein